MAESCSGEEQWPERRLSLNGQPGASRAAQFLAQAGGPCLEIEARRTVPPGSGPLGNDQRQPAGPMGLKREPERPCSARCPGPALAWRGNLLRLTELQSPELKAPAGVPALRPLAEAARAWSGKANLDLALRGAAVLRCSDSAPCSGFELEQAISPPAASLRGSLAEPAS